MMMETLIRLEPFCGGNCTARVVVDGQTPALLVMQGVRYVDSIPLGVAEYRHIQREVDFPQRFQSAMCFMVALQKGCLDDLGPTS